MFSDPNRMLDFSNWLYGFAALLTLLATLGVIYFGRVASALKDAQVKQYQKDADVRIAEAGSVASIAQQKAAEANRQAVVAGAHAAEAVLGAETARAASSKAVADAAKANEETERLRKDRVSLETQLAVLREKNNDQAKQLEVVRKNIEPRRVTNAQAATVRLMLQKHAGENVTLAIYSNDYETGVFAQEVQQAISGAGLTVGLNQIMSVGSAPAGQGIVVHDINNPPTLAVEIAKAFVTSGIPLMLYEQKNMVPIGQFQIVIGSKIQQPLPPNSLQSK